MDSIAPFRTTVCGIDELRGHCEARVTHVLSILDPGFQVPAAFGSYGEHARVELRFNDVIDDLPGQVPPAPEHVEQVLAFGRDLMAEAAAEAHLLVHCHAGVSRSTAALALILAQARPERPAAEAMTAVVRIRPIAWPNLRIIELGDALLGRGGDLVAAARQVYRNRLAREPEMALMMRLGGRGREVA